MRERERALFGWGLNLVISPQVYYNEPGASYRIGQGVTGDRRQSGCCTVCTITTMPTPYLPVELLDHVVDHLHDTKDALSNCCLVSRSWIPRARKHLFADVWFETKGDLGSWKETFPNPLTSPARYTENLRIDYLHDITAADAELGGWIRDFSRVVHFRLTEHGGWRISLLPFRGFSPAIKSLDIELDTHPLPPTFDIIFSFPLLENLTVGLHGPVIYDGDDSDGLPTVIHPSDPPMFTGSLKLIIAGLKPVIHQLLSLPSGIHFWKLTVTWIHERDISPTTALVERCSHSLESLNIYCNTHGASIRHLFPYSSLTFVSSRVSCTRSLEGDKTQRCDFLAHIPKRWVDHRGNPNHHTQTSRASEGLDSCSSLLDPLQR